MRPMWSTPTVSVVTNISSDDHTDKAPGVATERRKIA